MNFNLRAFFKRPQKVPKGQHIEPIHHFHVRKRVHHWFEDYPHPNWWKRLMDRAVFIVGAVGPIATIPQIVALYTFQDATGLLLFTWVIYIFLNFFWILYGIVHAEKPIIFTYSCWVCINIAMAIGIILYS